MKFIELYEGATPKLPGAFGGVKVMTPAQFVAKSGESDSDEVDEGWIKNAIAAGALGAAALGSAGAAKAADLSGYSTPYLQQVVKGEHPRPMVDVNDASKELELRAQGKTQSVSAPAAAPNKGFSKEYLQSVVDGKHPRPLISVEKAKQLLGQMNESIDEATKLPAQSRNISDPELTDYLDRIRKQEKEKTDKYKLPYIHRSSVVGYYNEEGQKYNIDAIKQELAQRPKDLLKKNEKMKHSDGELEQFFNIGFAALVGIALDESTNELIIVNTCPGAGSCKVDCFAMKGGKIQFQGPWLSDGRILTFLLNDPEGFFAKLKADIEKEVRKGEKGGYKVSIRWHDAGDFFSPEYATLAFKLAKELPMVDFYAYTKVADVALGEKPDNFMINWSEGAHTSQEKKIKSQDPELEFTKNSRIVPSDLFYDLLVKDEKKSLVKGPEGQWQVIPDKIPELKQRLAKQYNLSPNSILTYKEWDTKGKKIPNMKWNVIITPGEPDLTAKDPGVLSTLLLKH